MRVVALDAPDKKVTERRFRSHFTPPQASPPVVGAAGEKEGEGEEVGERAVTLCMELVHGEGCGVAEEANVILRWVDRMCLVALAAVRARWTGW